MIMIVTNENKGVEEKLAFFPIKTHTDCRHHLLLLEQDPIFFLFKHILLSESKTQTYVEVHNEK